MLGQRWIGEKGFLMVKKPVRRTRRTHTAALREDRALVALAEHFVLNPNHITEWKRQLLENAAGALGGEP